MKLSMFTLVTGLGQNLWQNRSVNPLVIIMFYKTFAISTQNSCFFNMFSFVIFRPASNTLPNSALAKSFISGIIIKVHNTNTSVFNHSNSHKFSVIRRLRHCCSHFEQKLSTTQLGSFVCIL